MEREDSRDCGIGSGSSVLFDYEIVEHQEGLPIKAYFVSVGQIEVHWHKDIELMLVLKGSVTLSKGEGSEVVKKGEMRVLNCYESHFLQETDEENIVLGLQIDGDLTKNTWYPLSHICFDDQSFGDKEVVIMNRKICQTISMMDPHNPNIKLKIMGNIYDLLHNMTLGQNTEFRPRNDVDSLESDFERLNSFTKHINERYSEKLTLQGVADYLYISKSHLSHFIKKRLGVSFQKFLNMIRLQHAYEAIVFSDKKMVDIASECGFSDVKYMTKIVKESYHMTPKSLRINRQSLKGNVLTMDKKGHKPFDLNEALELLSTYL